MPIAQVAAPLESGRVPQPLIVVPPDLKFIVPVAVPAAPVTVAVKVTVWPIDDGFADEETIVLEATGFSGTIVAFSAESAARLLFIESAVLAALLLPA